MIPPNTNNSVEADSEDGQALVELMGVVIICTIMGFGIYEAGVLFHNINVLNNATERAATHASRGAPWPVIQRVLYNEGTNMMDGALIEQSLPDASGGRSNIIVEIWNPQTNEPLVTQYEDYVEYFMPGQERIAPYMFWAQGYEVRVGTYLEIGIYVPFIRSFTLSTGISGSQTIQASNDSDRDGMFDQYEAEYGDWYADEGKGLNDDGDTWLHPVHRDGYDKLDSDSTANVDGDTETDYQGCDLTIVMLCDGASEDCDDSPGDEAGLEIYNPQRQNWTLTRLTSANEGTIWSGSYKVNPDEYVIISHDSVGGDTEYGDTGDSIDIVPDTPITISPASDEQAFKIFDGNAAICDRVGYYTESSSDGALSSDWYETDDFDASGLSTIEFRRKKFDGSIPVDSNDNSENFTPISSYAVRSEYELEKVYDYDNDGLEDKFDPSGTAGDTENLLRMNPIVGPVGWPEDGP